MEKNNKLLMILVFVLFLIMSICMIVGLSTRKEEHTEYYYYITAAPTSGPDYTSEIIETEYNIGTGYVNDIVYNRVISYDGDNWRVNIHYLGQKDFYE